MKHNFSKKMYHPKFDFLSIFYDCLFFFRISCFSSDSDSFIFYAIIIYCSRHDYLCPLHFHTSQRCSSCSLFFLPPAFYALSGSSFPSTNWGTPSGGLRLGNYLLLIILMSICFFNFFFFFFLLPNYLLWVCV